LRKADFSATTAIAVALMLNAFRDSIVFFNSPSDVAEKRIAAGTRIRLLVKAGASCAAMI
jgi:cytochrome c-type biogenesis protein CcmE